MKEKDVNISNARKDKHYGELPKDYQHPEDYTNDLEFVGFTKDVECFYFCIEILVQRYRIGRDSSNVIKAIKANVDDYYYHYGPTDLFLCRKTVTGVTALFSKR
ncbi:hypothetical protein LguiA_029066 [Lonicera macranthoides]